MILFVAFYSYHPVCKNVYELFDNLENMNWSKTSYFPQKRDMCYQYNVVTGRIIHNVIKRTEHVISTLNIYVSITTIKCYMNDRFCLCQACHRTVSKQWIVQTYHATGSRYGVSYLENNQLIQ